MPSVVLEGPDGQRVSLQVEMATDEATRQQGLMFRESLGATEGMLFVFETSQPLTFWMKNTLIPLDILFFDQTGKFVSADTMTPCVAEPCPVYPSLGEATYALEVNAGFVEEQGIEEGWQIQFP